MIDDLMKHYGEHKDIFYDRLESALRTARNEALEEACVRLDRLGEDGWAGTWVDAMTLAMDEIAFLKHKDGQP